MLSNEFFRREKLSLGIDSLLAMSILMMMVSEQMPTSSDFVPLFGIFYLSIIFIIFIGTLFTAFILNVHLQKMYAKPVSPIVSYIFFGRVSLNFRGGTHSHPSDRSVAPNASSNNASGAVE